MGDNIDWNALNAVYSANAPVTRPLSPEDRLMMQDTRYAAEERAGIMEYDGGLSREDAEAYAFQTVRESVV